MKVITFSQKFPVKHPRAGQLTNFCESILNGSKKHTIRAGNRWKVGERFSARSWSGRPYASKQIEFAEIVILKLWPVKIEFFNDSWWASTDSPHKGFDQLISIGSLAMNDGLSYQDFIDWFAVHPKIKQESFTGQIICWDENLEY